MDRTMTRRRLLGTGAAMAAAAPLARLPFPENVPAVPTASDTTATDVTADDRDWLATRHTTVGPRGARMTVADSIDPTIPFVQRPSALYIRPADQRYYAVLEFLRRSERQQDEWDVPHGTKVRSEWIWSVPEPLRAVLMGLISDAAHTVESRVEEGLANTLFGHLEDTHGRNSGEVDDDDDWEWYEYSDAERLQAFQRPTTIGAVLLAICEDMQMDPCDWLNERDLALLRQAT